MNPHDDVDLIERQLRPWLAEEGMVREPKDLFERVASGTRGVRQRPAWLVRLSGNGLVGAGAGPTARWREHRMATTLGLGTIVVATVLAISNIGPDLLQGQSAAPGAMSESPSPSASSPPEVPVWVTGTITGGDVQSYGRSWSEDGIGYAEGPWWTISLEASDPRLSAEGTYSQNWHEAQTADQYGVGTQTYVLATPDGRWVGSGDLFLSSSEQYSMVVLHGDGAYEGLTAKVLFSSDFSSPDTFVGVITPGQPPEFPEAIEPPAEAGAIGEAVVWHRLNPDGPEHERLACSEMDGTLSCAYDKVEEPDFAWDAGTARFSGDDVTASWACPAWFPAAVCDGVVSVWSGTTRYQPVEGEAAEVPQELVVTEVAGQPQLWLQFIDWALACPWYGTFEEALAANPDGAMDCVSGG